MDDADRAKIVEERELEHILASHSATAAQRAIDTEGCDFNCIDCDELIPQARVNIGFTVRCVDCQDAFEREVKR